jgi:hypothetical protein
MSLPIKAEIRGFDLPALINDAKQVNVFDHEFPETELTIKTKQVSAATLSEFIRRYPMAAPALVNAKKKTVTIRLNNEGIFIDVLFALLDAELDLLGKDISNKKYDDTRSSIIREFRRQVPFTSMTYGFLEDELTREKIMIDTSTEEFKQNVEDIVAKVKAKRKTNGTPKRTGLI